MNEKGFTLIEVLIGIVILGVGILGIAGLQVTAIRGNFFSNSITQATYSAQAGVEVLNTVDMNSPELQPGKHNDKPAKIGGITFTRSYTVVINGNFRAIDYAVNWNDGMNRSVSFSTLRLQ